MRLRLRQQRLHRESGQFSGWLRHSHDRGYLASPADRRCQRTNVYPGSNSFAVRLIRDDL